MAAKSKPPKLSEQQVRLNEVLKGRKTSLHYQKTADNVASALEFSLVDKKIEIRRLKEEAR